MTAIYSIDHVRKAYVRCLALSNDPGVAVQATAQALGLSIEAVHDALREETEEC